MNYTGDLHRSVLYIPEKQPETLVFAWWAVLGSNQCPLPCEGKCTPTGTPQTSIAACIDRYESLVICTELHQIYTGLYALIRHANQCRRHEPLVAISPK